MINKKKLLIAIIPVFIIGIILYTKPVIKNIIIEANTYKTPANNAFKDENFYKCVVDAYNKENDTTLGYDVNLTEEQLNNITGLYCDSNNDNEKKITDISGIEKIKNLLYVSLTRNDLTNVDLHNNVLLKSIYLGFNFNLENVNVKNLQNLEEIYIDDSYKGSGYSGGGGINPSSILYKNLNEIDLTDNINLKTLKLSQTNVTNLDLNNNKKLKILSLYGNNISSIDLTKYIELEELYLGNNQITDIDLSNNTKLRHLCLDSNKLSTIDLSNNTFLTYLDLDDNKLTSINLNNNDKIWFLDLSYNQITNIDLSNNTKLRDLYLDSNKLSTIDLSNNLNLGKIELGWNNLSHIDLSNYNQISRLHINNNLFSDTKVFYGTKKLENYILPDVVKLPTNISSNRISLIKDGIDVNIDEQIIEPDSKIVIVDKYEHNGEIELIRNKYEIKYTFYTLKATSDKYIISEANNYIYTKFDVDSETIAANISVSSYEKEIDNLEKIVENNKFIIKYNDEIIKEFEIVSISSDKYDITKEYFIGNIVDITNNIIVTNGKAEFNLLKNKVEIKHNDDVLQEFDYVNYTSDKYDLNSDYIKVNDNNIESFLNNINCTNCNAYIYDGTKNLTTGEFKDNYKLRIMHNDEILKEYELKYSVSGVSLNINDLKLNLDTKKTFQLNANVIPASAENKNVTWKSSNTSVATVDENGLVTAKSLGEVTITVKTIDGEFIDTCNVVVSEIIIYTVTFKDKDNTYTSEFEEGENIIFKSDLEKKGYKLIGWKYNNQNYSLTDKLPMPSNNIELTSIWELVIPEIKNYTTNQENITGISLKTNINNLNLGIDSIYNVKIKKHDGTDKTSGLVSTGDKIKIYLDNELVSEYDIIIKGDVTGTGTSSVSDVAKLYQYMREKITMEDCYIKAGNVVDSDSIIKVNDVAKLYQFIKGKIDNL